MKLYGSLTSPFVRVARIAAIELGLADRVEFVPTIVKPTDRNDGYASTNPLRKVPALELDDGTTVVDSRVVVERLNAEAGGAIVPAAGPERIDCLNRYAVVSGSTDALVLVMYETRVRPEALRWDAWVDDQVDKTKTAIAWCEERVGAFSADFDLGAIGLVAMLDYAAFRFPETPWLAETPALRRHMDDLGARPSVAETAPRDG
ncbi:MAG: glutathione S-transferase family protein [Parvularculaceae bacterium]